MKINKDHKLFKVCTKPKKNEIVRRALTGIYFDKKNEKLIATNGHALAMSKVTDCKNDKPCILSVEAYKEASKKNETLESNSDINVEGTKFQSIDKQYPDYPYPDYERVLPDTSKPTVKICLNAKLLHELSDALGADNNHVILTLTNNNMESTRNDYLTVKGAIHVQPNNKNNGAEGLIMPVRVDEF